MSLVLARPGALGFAALLGGAVLLHARPAQAGWHGGFFIGVPPVIVAPAPVYPYPVYPPAYYPPAYYPPYPYPYPYPPQAVQPQAQGTPHTQSDSNAARPSASPVAYGATCYAGIYYCAAPVQTPVGSGCSCPGIGAPSYGSVQ